MGNDIYFDFAKTFYNFCKAMKFDFIAGRRHYDKDDSGAFVLFQYEEAGVSVFEGTQGTDKLELAVMYSVEELEGKDSEV